MAFFGNNNPSSSIQPDAVSGISVDIQPIMKRVFMLMTLGMLTTTAVAAIANFTGIVAIALNPIVALASMLVAFGVAMFLSFRAHKLAPGTAGTLFFVFAALVGFALSSIVLVYTPGSIISAFVTTTALFGGMAFIGYTTKADLTKLGTYLMIGLFGLLVAIVVNWFIGSSALDFLISIVGVVIFTGLTAYDTQKIKEMAESPDLAPHSDDALRLGVIGALILYLDFLNLFLFVLQLVGGGRD